MTTIGVIGLGAMGSRIARRLHSHGYDVSITNRTKSKAVGLIEMGCSGATRPERSPRLRRSSSAWSRTTRRSKP